MFDILTVVFREELSILRVQAQSIDLYCRDVGIKNIFVVVNDTDDLADDVDVNWYGKFSKQVKIIPRSRLGSQFHSDGWMSQQYLKLQGSTLSSNKWVMVLDAKSIFIKTLNLKKFFDVFGRIRSGYSKLGPFWHDAEQNVNQLFNIQLQGASGRIPYLFRVDLVKNMINHIETTHNTSFDIWFNKFPYGHITEISLYFSYVQSVYRTLWKYASKNKYINAACAGRNRIDIADTVFDTELFEKRNHMVMIHRYVWNVLSTERKEKYKKFLIDKGLSTAENLV